ncbi:hypothetical protein, partial [Catenovulum sediminis]
MTRLYKIGTVSVTNGSAIVTGSGTNWTNTISAPKVGDLFTLDMDLLYEITALTNTQITLDRPFLGSTQSGASYSIIRHASASDVNTLNLDIANLVMNREHYVDNLDKIISDDVDEVTHKNRFGETKTIKTLHKSRTDLENLQAQAQSLIGSLGLPTKAEFETRHEGKYAGSGFVEWGKHYAGSAAGYDVVNQGLGIYTGTPNTIRLGR